MNNDVKLFYFGGSGGFFCLHLLLLTGIYNCKFRGDDQNFENIFKKQWNITDIKKWKSTETWPDNDATMTSDLNNKIYYICNDYEFLPNKYHGKTIVLYTDIETQCYLAMTKNAWLNCFKDQTNNSLLNYYKNVKAQEWPDMNNIHEFKNLPDKIKEECLNRWKFNELWPINDLTDQPVLSSYGVPYKNEKIFHKLVTERIFDQADIVVKLQDLIKTNGDILFDRLGIKGNSRCKDFVELWLNKHTPEQLKYLLS
jgi:hypothetical protein